MQKVSMALFLLDRVTEVARFGTPENSGQVCQLRSVVGPDRGVSALLELNTSAILSVAVEPGDTQATSYERWPASPKAAVAAIAPRRVLALSFVMAGAMGATQCAPSHRFS
jgi:hypothetical protein